ncbi:MAG: ribose-phosphate pyrophosphokinase [Bacteroidia bacterium]|nr:ribose-phosphate pyrophosphokinase [Bacteroidia bacterium]
MSYETQKFDDGQVSAKLTNPNNLHVKLRGNSYEDLFKAASIKEAWDHQTGDKGQAELTLYCLIAQRSDRRFNENESFDLKVVARFINQMGFDRVNLLHPHSSVTPALIEKSRILSHLEYVKKAYHDLNNPVLISPDAGAYKEAHGIAETLGASLIPANKVRVDGAPKIELQGDVTGKTCLIVDDIADGGRTFIRLAHRLRESGAEKVYLYVTHAMFHYGFNEVEEALDGVYCTNSYRDLSHPLIRQYDVLGQNL